MSTIYGFGMNFDWARGTSPSTALLDGSGDKIGGVFLAPKAGTIDRIGIYCTGTAGTVPSYTAQLETVSGGYPTGTIIAAGASGTVTPTANTLHLVSLTTPYTVAKNDLFATTLNSASATGSNNATFNLRINQPFPSSIPPYHACPVQDLTVGSWSSNSVFPCIVPVYDDGSYLPLSIPRITQTTTDFANNSNPDEIGIRWTQAGSMRCFGGLAYVRMLSAGSDWKMKLYDVALGDSAAPVAEITITQSVVNRGTSFEGVYQVYWSSTVNLVDGSDYRLTYVPTSTNQIRTIKLTFGSAAMRQAMSHAYYTQRLRTADGDAGTWTDDTSSAMLLMTPVIDQNNKDVASLLMQPTGII